MRVPQTLEFPGDSIADEILKRHRGAEDSIGIWTLLCSFEKWVKRALPGASCLQNHCSTLTHEEVEGENWSKKQTTMSRVAFGVNPN
jgi:hypothetical protein